MIYNETLNGYENIYNSCTIHIGTLFVIAFLIIIDISNGYFYFLLVLKKN